MVSESAGAKLRELLDFDFDFGRSMENFWRMEAYKEGQRFVSEPEPELGLGIIDSVDNYQIGVSFPAAGERRLYAKGAGALKRVTFREGDRVSDRSGLSITITAVDDDDGLLLYRGEDGEVREDTLADASSFSHPQDRLLAGQVDDSEVFGLRYEALRMQGELRASPLRGFLGGRVDLIPHQYYILREVSSRQFPRVLLSDEVGLGKTIEACLILQRLRSVGRANRALVIVPESLIHQWFVELLRRFNLWFSIFDEDRCLALEASGDGGNPFLDEQLVLCSVGFLAQDENRAAQAVEAGWDIVIVDEAHHLEWSPQAASREYQVVEALGRRSPGLLLLTATPTQLGIEGHFARLRLLDPDRYSDLEAFREEVAEFGAVASIAGKVIDEAPLGKGDRATLKRIFHRDPKGLQSRLEALDKGKPGARSALIRALLDEHGTGRVVFRNTRGNMKGFPKRMYCPAPLDGGDDSTLMKRLVREFEAESRDAESEIRYRFKGDPRFDWLVAFLKARKGVKTLLICRSLQKVLALEAALREAINVNIALFHEELPLVQRDRNAAWFAEEDGAQLLICSEIGSEGRNFQFAHHLVLFDLPINPGLLEQRIGRLDRIGQTDTIHIHFPYVVGSPHEFVAQWCHEGLDGFESCVHGGTEYVARFGERLIDLALAYGSRKGVGREELERFIEETETFRAEISARLRSGRDRLLELNSFDPAVADDVIKRIRQAEADSNLRQFLFELLEFFGVRVEEYENRDALLDPSRAYVEAFPSLPPEGALATFDRGRAIAREDLLFLTADQPLVWDSIGLLVNSERGVAAFCIRKSDTQNVCLEAVFALEPVALSSLHVDRYLSPTPLRVVVDLRGNDLSKERDLAWMKVQTEDGDINRFLERPGFGRDFLEAMLGGAEAIAEQQARRLRTGAKSAARDALSAEIERLVDLQKINENVTTEEVSQAKRELKGVLQAIDAARLRLDSLRILVEGDVEGLRRL